MSEKKKKPKFDVLAYGYWDDDEGNEDGGYVALSYGPPEDLSVRGEKKVLGVYKLVGYVTVEEAEPKPPEVTVSKLRSKP